MSAPKNLGVSLPMYNFPEMRAANARFWEALRGLLLEAGLEDAPEALVFERGPVPDRLETTLLFSQTCGYPLETVFKGQAIRLGAPLYDMPGCDSAPGWPTHRAIFLVRKDSPAQTLFDLKDSVFLLNSTVSNSGMNLPRRALAEIAGGKPFFGEVIETGGHPASLDRLIRGEGDVASIDCVTYAFWRHYRPEAAAQVRILAETPVSPAIPFVTSVATPPAIVDLLRNALRMLGNEPRYAAARAGLMIAGIEDVPNAAYEGLLDYEREAAERGYPELL
jgi:ABC-type phosphate/phosphonate transport system substrate-binding protein